MYDCMYVVFCMPWTTISLPVINLNLAWQNTVSYTIKCTCIHIVCYNVCMPVCYASSFISGNGHNHVHQQKLNARIDINITYLWKLNLGCPSKLSRYNTVLLWSSANCAFTALTKPPINMYMYSSYNRTVIIIIQQVTIRSNVPIGS